MMKMHGLGDGPYWMISYIYFLIVSSIYMLCFVIFGSLIGKYYISKTILLWFFFQLLEQSIWRSNLIKLIVYRIKILHIEWLQHPICLLFHLHQLASINGLSSIYYVFKCEDFCRFESFVCLFMEVCWTGGNLLILIMHDVLIYMAMVIVLMITVIGYICVFGTGLLGASLFEFLLHTPSFPSKWTDMYHCTILLLTLRLQ